MWEDVSDGEKIDSDDQSEEKEKSDEESDDDILVKVAPEKRVKIPEQPEPKKEKPFVPSKIKKKDIGKTRQLLDADGQVIENSLDALKVSMNVLDEKEALKDASKDSYFEKVRSQLEKTKDSDAKAEKKRIKDIKKKKKQQLKRQRVLVDDDGVQLATPSEGSYQQEDSEGAYESESI